MMFSLDYGECRNERAPQKAPTRSGWVCNIQKFCRP
jgi:hypothetical protein